MAAKRLTKAQRQQLWQDLRDDLTSAREKLDKIIEHQAWKPEYPTLLAAWQAHLTDVHWAPTALSTAVYHMIDEGASSEEIAEAMRGISVTAVDTLKRKKDMGVPPEAATRSNRRPPRDTIFLHVGAGTYAHYEELANAEDSTIMEIALKFVEQGFARLEKAAKRRAA
jgi:hypothetical protein